MVLTRRQADEMRGAGQNVPATKRDLASVESSLTRDVAARAIRQEVRDQFESIRQQGREIVDQMRELRREARTIKWMAATALTMMALITTGVIALALS